MNEFSTIASFFKQGGVFMYLILATAIVIAAIVVERFLVISKAAKLDSRKMIEDVTKRVGAGDVQGARQVSHMSNAPVAMIAQAILDVNDPDTNRLQMAADDAATLAMPPLSRRLAYLNVLANVCTLLGLLGTIAGLIQAFTAVGAADPSQRSSLLAAGISTALNATAFGLVIAIPTLVIHGYLLGLIEGIAEQVDEASIRLTHALAKNREAHRPASVVAMPQARPVAAPVQVRPAIAAGQ
jgi:biopolymer transport protein ExbB/TolQ